MKKILLFAMAVLLLFAVVAIPVAAANVEPVGAPQVESEQIAVETIGVDAGGNQAVLTDLIDESTPALPDTFTWAYLLTTGGAALFVYFVVRFAKAPLDKVWKIPTRLLVYVLCLITLLVANAFFNHGINGETAALCTVNALISAYVAYGMYEVWDKKDSTKA